MAHLRVDVTTTGTAGSATGTGQTRPVMGVLSHVHVDYHASAPGTTDVTISEAGGLGRTLLTLTNRNTDGTFYPAVAQTDGTGAAFSPASYGLFYIEGTPLKVDVAGCDALTDAVKVSFGVLEG